MGNSIISKQRSLPLVELPRCYLDWNIFVDFAKNTRQELKELLLIAREEGLIQIPYTEWHLHEAVNVAPEVGNRDELVLRNLQIMKEVTDLVCIWEYEEPPGWRIMRFPLESTFDIATTQKLVMFWELLKPLLVAFTTLKERLLSFGLVPGTLNRFSPEEVIEEINRILCKPENVATYKEYAPNGITFEEIVNLTLSVLPEIADGLQLVASVYFLIDQIGYFSDKSVKKNVMSLWRDEMHVA